ncbi:MAG: dTDP-4-dehydrorhamnose reductase [Eubacteriales bacterium]|nr:dTDP-4-dehydrorhamnose reductase [Eubacteriales bacterium]
MNPRSILITGVNGQLGYDVLKEARARGLHAVGSGSSEKYHGILPLPEGSDADCGKDYIQMDITDEKQVEDVFSKVKPDLVVHCAAWTNVDGAEDPENREKVFRVNETGTENIAKAAEKCGASVFFFSTDYIFDGQGNRPWNPDLSVPKPLNVYGESKLAGENKLKELCSRYFILRISWVFGRNGGNFVKTMLRLSETHDSLRIVDDQIGRPTYTADLARLILDMVGTDRYGIYHVSNEGEYISWADFAAEIFQASGKKVRIDRVSTEEYGVSKAARPKNSRLDTSKITENGFEPLPDWKDALRRFLADEASGEIKGM